MSFSGEAQEFYIDIPSGYSVTARRQLAEIAIAKILDRTERGIDKDDKPFDDLEADYAAKKAEMGGLPIPNLRLTGEMRSDLEYRPSRSSSQKLCIGFTKGSESNAKARGHITGWEDTNPKKKRDFLGLPQKEIDSLIDQYPPDEETNLLLEAIKLKDLVSKIATGVNIVTEI